MESGAGGERTMEDIDEQALTYAELKAIASGNPLILEKFTVESELKRLSSLRAKFDASQRSMTHILNETLPKQLNGAKLLLALYKKDARLCIDTSGDKFIMDLLGHSFTERAKAAEFLGQIMSSTMVGVEKYFGQLSGFSLFLKPKFYSDPQIIIKGNASYVVEDCKAGVGTIIKIENALRGIGQKAIATEKKIGDILQQIEEVKTELDKPFSHAAKIGSLRERKAIIDTKLDIDKIENIGFYDMTPGKLGMEI